MKNLILFSIFFLASPLMAETRISGDLQYWCVDKRLLTATELKRARAYGQKNSREGFWNLNLIKCNTNYWMGSLTPNATEQMILNTWRSQGKAFYYRARHFVNKDGRIDVVDSTGTFNPRPLDWDKDWTFVEKSTPQP